MRLFLLAALAAVCSAYKMVLIAPDMAKSQVMFNKRVAETLAEAGHDVTIVFISMFDKLDYSEIKIDKRVHIRTVNATIGVDKDEVEAKQAKTIFKDVSMMDPAQRAHIALMLQYLQQTCRNTLRDKEFLRWLEAEKFDLAFAHIYHACPIGLIHAAKIPSWIWLNSGQLMDFVSDMVGVPTIPSYVPPVMMAATDRMSFFERCKSLIGNGLMKFIWPRFIAEKETQIFRDELDPNFPSLVDLARKCPLVMVNSNELYELPRPTLAKVINIGGIGVQEKDTKPLNEEFSKIIAKGKGLFIFSFGSVAPAHKMPQEWKDSFLAAFAKFPDYQFVIRYEQRDLDAKLPPNVHVFKWLPQADLLGHPRTKGFITHGGYNSLQEGITAGKPLITIALFGDQPKNAMIAKKHGMALDVKKSELSEETLTEAIDKIINDKSYSEKAQRLRDMVRRKPVSAEHLLVKWAEFAAEFKELENLEPAGQYLNFFQYHSIDVMLVLAGIVLTLFWCIYRILKAIVTRLYRRFCCQKKEKTA